MTRKIRRFARLGLMFLTCVLFAVYIPPQADASFSDRVIRVGLYYGSNALPSANLANEVGSGYQFGTYNSSGTFTPLGSTAQEKITVCKDANLYLSGGSFYETPTAADYQLIGAYHIQMPDTYTTYEAAAQAAAAYPYGFPAYINGNYVVRFEFYSSAANAEADAAAYSGAQVVGGSKTCYTVVNTATGQILFEFDNGGDYLGIQPMSSGERARTWFKGYQYYGGFQYMRRSGNDISVINFVNEDLYVSGVLPYEFVVNNDLESLKAGAVAIRTFSRASTKHSALGFDICNTTDCQVYRGVYTGAGAQLVLDAVEQTGGQCAYYNGALIEALYFSSDGGATEDAVNAWGSDVPYLKGKVDPYEDSISFNGKSWSYTVTPSEIQSLMQSKGYNCGTVTGLEVTKTTAMGNVNELTITDSNGKKFTFTGDNVRVLQNLPGVTYMSRRFQIAPIGSQPTENPATTTGDNSLSVYDGNTTVKSDTITVITGSGTQQVTAPATVITDSGTVTVGENGDSGSSGSSSDSTQTGGNGQGWTITGGGFGHNIGMSQWGAYAMGQQGYSYEDILKFYYTGITIQ